MKYLSVCSGIEAASVAWEPLGWQPIAFSEIEPFPSAVLAHHWPEVPNLGDFTTIERESLAALPDVLIGGTPCQAFSVAGLRQSLEDERGNLTLEFVRLADRLDDGQLIIVWENVPGVLNTPDNAFGCFLGAVVGCDTALQPPGKRWGNAGVVAGPTRVAAWRVLDAQYFGVAQRRRRVFVVASAREGFDPASVLLERDGVLRDSAPSREPREGAAAGAGIGTTVGGDLAGTLTQRHDSSEDGTGRGTPIVIDRAAFNQGENAQYDPHIEQTDVMDTLVARGPHAVCAARMTAFGEYVDDDSASTLKARDYKDATDLVVQAEPPRVLSEQRVFRKSARARTTPENGGYETWVDDGTANTLNCFDVGERDTHAIVEPMAFESRIARNGRGAPSDVVPCLKAEALGKSDSQPLVASATMAVRRLTPRECERLQGFPDDHTLIPWKNGRYVIDVARSTIDTDVFERVESFDCPDGPRYKCCGNSMAVPVIRWIGRRIEEVS